MSVSAASGGAVASTRATASVADVEAVAGEGTAAGGDQGCRDPIGLQPGGEGNCGQTLLSRCLFMTG